jgi:hypothetical protein
MMSRVAHRLTAGVAAAVGAGSREPQPDWLASARNLKPYSSCLLFCIDNKRLDFPAAPRFREADLDLRIGTANYLVYINISRLLDRIRNGAGNRLRRNRHLVHLVHDLGFDLRIRHGIREVRVDESRRNVRHAQLIAGFLAQTLGDRAHGVLRAGIDRHGRSDLNSGCGLGEQECSRLAYTAACASDYNDLTF